MTILKAVNRLKDSFHETNFQPVNSLTGYYICLAFGLVTPFFGIKGAFFSNNKMDCHFFFQNLGENSCSFQTALKSNATGL